MLCTLAQGLIDSRILKDAMPICREYFAVEPDLYNVNGLKKSLHDYCPPIKVIGIEFIQ